MNHAIGGAHRTLTKRQFRAVVILPAMTSIIGLIASTASEAHLPATLRDYLEAQRSAELTLREWIAFALFIPLLLAAVASVVGLLRFSNWSRPLAVVQSALSIFLLPLIGPTVESGTVTALFQLSAVLWGAVLALAFWSPAAAWFEPAN